MNSKKEKSSHQDLITCLLSIRGDDTKELVSEDEIIHNVMLIMIAGHDTSSVLITLIVWHLANDATVYEAVLRGQEEIKNSKPSGELLNWEDLAKKKYSWRVAMEILRTIPPIFGGFRKTLEDIEYEEYLIPKGWQNLVHLNDPTRFEDPVAMPPYSYIPFGAYMSRIRVCKDSKFSHYPLPGYPKLCCSDNCFGRDPLPVPTQDLPTQIVSKIKQENRS